MVVVPDGPSRRVGPAGVLIGRQRDCDIVATDPAVSRRHALVRLTGDGAEVVPLGKTPVEINGEPTTNARPLRNGDELRLPGLLLILTIEIPRPSKSAITSFVLERAGSSFGVTHSPFVIGGGDSDDLIVKKWPASALLLHTAQGMLYVEAKDGNAAKNGEPIEPDMLELLAPGDQLAYRDETFVIAQAQGSIATTAVGGKGDLPTRVQIEILPRGGRVVFTISGRESPVYLSDRRFDLMVALLRPPTEYKAGDLIPDDTVRSIVWPRKPAVSRPEINMLISRCRRDLVDAGLAGPRLIERAQGGGATRVVLAPDAVIEVLS